MRSPSAAKTCPRGWKCWSFCNPVPDTAQTAAGAPRETLPLSLLNDYVYCRRRAALKIVEGWRGANAHTERGDVVHGHADLPGYEIAAGVTLLRALPVWSEVLGLLGKCDIVEASVDGGHRPVEYKSGQRRPWGNDDVQLCAQALCLEEMFGRPVPRGAVYHAESRRRREVEFTPELRAQTAAAAAALHALAAADRVPAAEYLPGCPECSLFNLCLPKATAADNRAARLVRQLFEV